MNKTTLQNPQYQTCIDTCNACAEACDACCTACMCDMKNVGMMTRCMMMTRDCAMMCVMAATCMARGSEYAKKICMMCAEMCEACAMECEKHSSMEQCKQCAETCRMCAQECKSMTR